MGFIDHRPWEHNQPKPVRESRKKKSPWCRRCCDNILNYNFMYWSKIDGIPLCIGCQLREIELDAPLIGAVERRTGGHMTDKQKFDGKLRALRLDLEHLERHLEKSKNYSGAATAIDKASDALLIFGDEEGVE